MPAAEKSRRLQKACDRCYRLKERCTRKAPTNACERCRRLGLPCETVRPLQQMGRRPKELHRIPSDIDVRDCHSSDSNPDLPLLDIGRWINDAANLTHNEKKKLSFLLDQPTNLEFHVVCPGFQNAERQSLAAPLPAALPVLKDAYLAFAGALKSTHTQHYDASVSNDEDANLLHALAGIKILRTLPTSTPQEAALCVNLGIALTMYTNSTVGQGIYEITQHCLSVARPFIESETLDEGTESWLRFLALLELTECLIRRQKPTMRIPWKQSRNARKHLLDRHMGLCAPLLPYYHDLCVISHSMVNTTDASYMAMFEKQLSKIQAEVQAWQPSQPDQFLEQYKSTEVLHLLSQAKLYRLGALLIGHRLRYTFGEQDEQATIWANEIMHELELVRQVTSRSAHCVTLPFVTAAIEMRDTASRGLALQNSDLYAARLSPVVRKVIKTFLSRVWWERDHGIATSWFDSTHKPCIVLSSIDAALSAPRRPQITIE